MSENHSAAFETLYLKERRKTKYFIVSTAVFAVLFVGALVVNPKSKVPANGPGGFSQQGGFPSGGPGGQNGPSGMSVKSFLNSDGSVNQSQVDQLLNNVPSNFKSNLLSRLSSQIDDAVTKGDITSAQGTALKQAFGISSGSSS